MIDAKRKRETEKGSAEAERDTDSRVRANHCTRMLCTEYRLSIWYYECSDIYC